MQTKVCTKCKKEKPLDKFNKNKRGLRAQCAQCDIDYAIQYRAKHREKMNAATRKWYKSNPEKVKAYSQRYREKHLERIQRKQRENNKKYYDKYTYGLEENARLKMYNTQRGQCAICNQPFALDKTCVDHDHKTGKIRGLLCYRCNILLAGLDDEEFNRKARAYLKNSAQ